jgi:hypothetical protein
LTEAEQAAIEAHGLFNLADFLPKKPSEAELRIIKEMFEASVDGRPYDSDKWSAYYRPYGLAAPSNQSASPTIVDAEPVHGAHSQPIPDDDIPFETSEPVVVPKAQSTSSDKAADILAMIKARQNNKA